MAYDRPKKRSCKLCEKAILASKDEQLIQYRGWLKSIDKFNHSMHVCDGCLASWSKKNQVPMEFYDQAGFWVNWHNTMLQRIKLRVSTEEQAIAFQNYKKDEQKWVRRLLMKIARNPNETVSTGKTFVSYMEHLVFKTPFVKHKVQESSKADLAKLAKDAVGSIKQHCQ